MEEMTKTILLLSSGGLAGAIVTLSCQAWLRWYNRPRLRLVPYEHRPPMYRLAPAATTGKQIFWVNVGVRNRGRLVAEKCRVVITAMATLKQDRWVRDQNWIPLDLGWTRPQVLERDLLPEPARKVRKWGAPVVYYFSIASIIDDGTNQLRFPVTYSSTGQRTAFPPGVYSVQIIVYSANGDWAGRWYEIKFRGETGSFSGDWLTVRELPAPPVPTA